jgi:hypothetical protein
MKTVVRGSMPSASCRCSIAIVSVSYKIAVHPITSGPSVTTQRQRKVMAMAPEFKLHQAGECRTVSNSGAEAVDRGSCRFPLIPWAINVLTKLR